MCSAKFNMAKAKINHTGSYLWMLGAATTASCPTADVGVVKKMLEPYWPVI